MSEEKQQKHWYQDGWVVLVIVVVGYFLFSQWKESQKLPMRVDLSGIIQHPSDGSTTFEVKCWHLAPGNLKNGLLRVQVSNARLLHKPDNFDVYSFEMWEPNQDHAIEFSFELPDYSPEREYHVTVDVIADNAHPYATDGVWQNDDWKRDNDAPTPLGNEP